MAVAIPVLASRLARSGDRPPGGPAAPVTAVPALLLLLRPEAGALAGLAAAGLAAGIRLHRGGGREHAAARGLRLPRLLGDLLLELLL